MGNVGVATVTSIVLFVLSIIPGFAFFSAYFFGEDIKQLKPYFTYNTIFTIVFNIACPTCVMAYFIWLCVDPLEPGEMYWVHPSNILRIALTVIYTIGKIFPFFIYNGRLRYAFKTGKYRTSQTLFTVLNAIIIILTPFSIICGYLGIFVFHNTSLEWLGFNGYRILYVVLLLLLSWLFNKRMFILLIEPTKLAHASISEIQAIKQSTSKQKLIIQTNDEDEDALSDTDKNEQVAEIQCIQSHNTITIELDDDILHVVIKSSLLLSFMIILTLIVMISWFLHSYVFDHSHQTLCIGFLCFSLDCVVDEICILLLYKYSQRYYALLCACACSKEEQLNDEQKKCSIHLCYSSFCQCFAKRYYKTYSQDII